MSKDVAKKQDMALAPYDYGEDAGIGFEDQSREALQIPFLTLLQAQTPIVLDDSNPEARAGRMLNTVTGEIFKDPITIVPAHVEHLFVEWVPKSSGGGLVAKHAPEDPVVARAKAAAKEFGKYKVGENDLVETFYMYAMLVLDGGSRLEPIVVSFSSTKIKGFRTWNTRAFMCMTDTPNGGKAKPPRWAHQIKIGTKLEKNAKGQYYVFTLEPAVDNDVKKSLLACDDPAYDAAKALYVMVKSGAAKIADEAAERPADEEVAF